MIRIGNQTAAWAATPVEPFDYALTQGFDAFEWFPDKKPGAGWDESDLDRNARQRIRELGRTRGIRFSVHGRWQANLLAPGSYPLVLEDLELARDLGAALLNIHLAHEQGLAVFVEAIVPLVKRTAEVGLQLAIENTPHHSPEEFNELFARLRALESTQTGHVGMCLDLGHANLCAATRNNYLGFVDRLDSQVPLIHLHLHENWGDADTHLPLFTGPAARDDSGIRGLVARLRKRNFSGSAILEQWPKPPALLNNARDRLLEMWKKGQEVGRVVLNAPEAVSASLVGRAVPRSPLIDAPEPHGAPEGSAGFQACRVAGFQTCAAREFEPAADLEVGDTAGLEACATAAVPGGAAAAVSAKQAPPSASGGDLVAELVAGDRQNRSWREKLDFVRRILAREEPALTADDLIDIAIYLRFLGTGEIPSNEDGRHFRPGHHARIAAQIQERLARLTTPDNAFIVRKIYPWLPSSSPAFQRPEPLTRIRDIAHRNDIDPDLKREIKTTLQNKLHRCAGPEDLATSAALLERITAPGASYSPAFVEQFKVFHEELKEFFNAQSLDERLASLAPSVDAGQAELIELFRRQKAGDALADRLAAFRTLTTLRQGFLDAVARTPGPENQDFLSADIALEDFAFVLLSEIINAGESSDSASAWQCQREALVLALRNLALSGVVRPEADAVEAELQAWGNVAASAGRDELLRLKATMQRCRRLAEDFGARTVALFSGRAEKLGRALGVAKHALRVFAEADIRAHIVFQVSKLATSWLHRLRQRLGLPGWDVLVAGRAVGRLKTVDSLEQLERALDGPVVALVKHAAGDEEIPKNVAAIVLAHELPHLSHLAVRARQAGVVFAACEEITEFERLETFEGRMLSFQALPDQVTWETAAEQEPAAKKPNRPAPRVPAVRLGPERAWIPLEHAEAETGGGKAAGARRLAELSHLDGAEFSTPAAFVVPFGVMEAQFDAAPVAQVSKPAVSPTSKSAADRSGVGVPGFGNPGYGRPSELSGLEAEYRELVSNLDGLPPEEFATTTKRLRELVQRLSVPDAITSEVARRFSPNSRLVVRSSANFEDVEGMAGAGLYDSVMNVAPAELASAIRTVWSSLWTRRAALSRQQAGIPHEQAHMAVLIQEMVVPDFSFVLHTVNPLNHRAQELYAEIVVGLGDTLASAATRGTPYRMVCDKDSGKATILAFANFSTASQPGPTGGLRRETVDYSRVELSRDATARHRIGLRLAAIGGFVEKALQQPQDIEGVVAGNRIFLVQTRPQPGL
ncbi:MAG TPA: PEP/pyruvate-binding domain-containing protein [Candidatus Acidoferrum sp.]|jgi:phosphoglucan,water dikinase|nr:PEP/pyruvate-binding domain-containing protein [Candidatus Acidoferrum sp.]